MTRIVIVDDDGVTTEDLTRQLEEMQYSVAGKAQTGEEGIRMALDLVPDLILMDIRFLKGMEGLAAAEKIREQANIPLIFLVDPGEEELIQRFGLNRPFSYVMKPCNPLELRASVEVALCRKKTEQDLREVHSALERKVSEQAAELVRSNERLKALMDANSDTAVLLELDGTIASANAVAAERFGMPIEAFIGLCVWALLPPALIQSRKPRIDQVIATAKPLQFEDARDGHVYDNRVYPVFDDEGEVIQVAIYGRDITRIQESIQALIRSEKELEDTAHAMEEANAAVRVLLRRREEDRIEFEKRVIANVRTFIRPHLRDLRKTPVDDAQASLLDDIESGLQMIVSPFARDLSTGTFDLTPMEIRVARLIKEGKSNKEMAQRLGVSTNTILTHRFNLRTKLGIRGKKIDLKRHLLSLSAESPLSQGLF